MSWKKEVEKIKSLYEQIFEEAKSKQGEFIWKEFGDDPAKIAIVGFLPSASIEGTQQGFFERMEGSGASRILHFLKMNGFSVAGARVVLDDDKSLEKLLAVLKNKPSVKFVGIASFSCEIDFAVKVAKAVKRVRQDIRLVLVSHLICQLTSKLGLRREKRSWQDIFLL